MFKMLCVKENKWEVVFSCCDNSLSPSSC